MLASTGFHNLLVIPDQERLEQWKDPECIESSKGVFTAYDWNFVIYKRMDVLFPLEKLHSLAVLSAYKQDSSYFQGFF